jgi:hypothetical protein
MLRGRYTPINYQSLADSIGPLIDLGDLGDVTYNPLTLTSAEDNDILQWDNDVSSWVNLDHLTIKGICLLDKTFYISETIRQKQTLI